MSNVFEDIDPEYKRQNAIRIKKLREQAIRQAIKNSSTLTKISKKAIRRAKDLGKKNKIREQTKEKIKGISKKIVNTNLGKKLPSQRAVLKRFNIPKPTSQKIMFRPATSRVNVLSDYNNDKFYPRRKQVKREVYLGTYRFR